MICVRVVESYVSRMIVDFQVGRLGLLILSLGPDGSRARYLVRLVWMRADRVLRGGSIRERCNLFEIGSEPDWPLGKFVRGVRSVGADSHVQRPARYNDPPTASR